MASRHVRDVDIRGFDSLHSDLGATVPTLKWHSRETKYGQPR